MDADPINLAYLWRSLQLGKSSRVRIIYNSISDEYLTLYPVALEIRNVGNNNMMTAEELKTQGLNVSEKKGSNLQSLSSQASSPGLNSILLQDLLDTIVDTDTIVMKIDIETYECKALLAPILLGQSGKFIPYIFIEWIHIAK